MAIRKQDFYEGAAIYQLVRSGDLKSISYESQLFLLNGYLKVLLKHCTKKRSPWSFTFSIDEQDMLQSACTTHKIVLGLICGDDGIAALPVEEFAMLTHGRQNAVHVSCFRLHGQHYEIKGPNGQLESKVAPSNWLRILHDRGIYEASY